MRYCIFGVCCKWLWRLRWRSYHGPTSRFFYQSSTSCSSVDISIGSRDGNVYVLSQRGGLKWRFEQNKIWKGTVFGIDAKNAEGKVRVLAGSRDNKVYALDKNGVLIWSYDTDHVVRQILVQDINNDGKLEVIVGSEDCYIYVLQCETGALLWKYRTNGWVRTVFAADINDDGEIEILAGSGDKYLYALDKYGQLLWKYCTQSKIHTILAIDLDNDGTVEILFGSNAKDICAITADHQIKWQFHLVNRIHSIIATDLNHDGRIEVVAGCEDGRLYFLNDHGQFLWQHLLDASILSIYITDLNHDSNLELIVGFEDNIISVLRIELLQPELHHKIAAGYYASESPSLTLLDGSVVEASQKKHDMEQKNLEEIFQGRSEIGNMPEELLKAITLSQQKVELLWQREKGYIRTICIHDVDKDGLQEIILGTDEGLVCVLNELGQTLWSYSFTDRVWVVKAGDVDFDGDVEIAVGVADSHVYLLSSTSAVIKWQAQMKDWIESISIVESELQNGTEMMMGSNDKKIYISSDHQKPATEPISSMQSFSVPHSIRALCVYDIDNDGTSEVVAGADDNNIYAYTKNGSLLWIYRTQDRIRAIQIADIDGDGKPETVVGSEDRNVYVLNDKGCLRWYYSTAHRVLDLDIIDIDQDGRCEILVGAADGYMYVLDADGDLRWRYKVSDRIRGVRAADFDRDGNVEIAIGSEDKIIYFLRIANQQECSMQIEHYWNILQTTYSLEDLLRGLALHQNPYLRAFVLLRHAEQVQMIDKDGSLLQALATDTSEYVRTTFAHTIALLYTTQPDQTRHFLDQLATDEALDVRLAFVDSLSEIARVDEHVGIEYFNRLTKDPNKWIRRNVVRKLYLLVDSFPLPAFRLLLTIAQDERDWVRQEVARALAHYFTRHTSSLITGLRTLISSNIDISILHWIANYFSTANISGLFITMADLLSPDLDSANVQSRLKGIVQVLITMKALPHGEEAWLIYNEMLLLHSTSRVEEIAQYRCQFNDIYTDESMRFKDTIQIFKELDKIATSLSVYLRREGFGDRLASLLEAIGNLEELHKDAEQRYFWPKGQKPRFPDYLVLELLLKKWRSIVTAEVSQLQGKADIIPELRTTTAHNEEHVAIWLDIHNRGRSPADNVKVTLQTSLDIDIIGSDTCEFETVPTQGKRTAEFIIKPQNVLPHLAFKILYDDVESRSKYMLFGTRLEIQEKKEPFRQIPNPYTAGTPIQTQEMFYGREDDLRFLKENLTFSSSTVIVLYGQRRSGKSSLLHQLVNTAALDPHIPVYIDMQRESLGITTSAFLYHVAYYIYRALKRKNIIVRFPIRQEFSEDPTFAFDLFLDQINSTFDEAKLVLLIDEFEILEQKVTEGALAPEIFEYLRSQMQHRRNLNFLLSGIHTIEHLSANYWSVFFNIARHRQLSKLNEEAAVKLISEPTGDSLVYDPLAIEKIRSLTADQPYLIQLICRSLVEYSNYEHKNYVTINDVNKVLREVMETGQVHFTWVWHLSTPDERIALSIIAQEGREEGALVSFTDIERIFQQLHLVYNYNQVAQALQSLIDRDILEGRLVEKKFRIPVGLIRALLRNEKPLKDVLLQENLLDQH